MYLNKKEAEWVRLVAVERLTSIKNKVIEIEDYEDRKWFLERSAEEIEALESVIDKIN